MNSRQGIFVTSLGVSGVVVFAWILSSTYGIPFSKGLLDALVYLGITGIISGIIAGIIAGCIIGAYKIYDALEKQEAEE